MSVPGSNLLKRALKLIKPTDVVYLRYSARTLNAAKQWVAAFEAPVTMKMSVQAVPRNTYVEWGLDFQKQYIQVWASANVLDLQRDISGDRIIWNGRLYQLESETTWFKQDGWSSCMGVDVGAAP